MEKMTEKKQIAELSTQEKRILDCLREVRSGELRVVVNAGKPILLEETRRTFEHLTRERTW